MRNFVISFVELCLYGCSPTILGHKITFAKHVDGAFYGECGEKIDQKIIYKFKDGIIRKIFYEDKEEFAYYDEIVIPIQSCEGEWCKIYYPCGERGYFVKKDEIEKWQWQ